MMDEKAATILLTLWTNGITMSARTISVLTAIKLQPTIERLINLRELGLIRAAGILRKGVDHQDQRWCVSANGKRVMAILSGESGD